VPVSVEYSDGSETNYDNGDKFQLDPGGYLSIIKTTDAVEKIVAIHSVGSWSSAKLNKKEDVQLKLEEALELVSLVDNGSFSNQDDDWKERAQALLND
jgi:hypothetical protein